jgi:hypothetical protein
MAAGTLASHGSPYINLTVNNAIVEHNDAIYAQGGVGAGTGNFDPFLTVESSSQSPASQDGTEDGYNQCDDPGCPDERGDAPFYYDQFFGGGRTHEILVSAIPTLEYQGTLYREFSLDANDEGNDTWMSIDEIKIFVDSQVNLTTYVNSTETFGNDTGTAASEIFDMDEGEGGDQTILMVSQGLESGSGVSDVTVLVPNDLFPAECYYGAPTGTGGCNLYLYFWTAMGHAPDGDHAGVNCTQDPCDWDVSAGFEEWRIRFLPVVNISKTANETFTRDYGWTVDKTVDPETLALFDGDTADVTWEVTPTRDAGTDGDFLVSGTITITNPTGAVPIPTGIDAEVLSLEDVLTLDGNPINVTNIDCEFDGDPITFPFTLDPGDSIECTYEVSTPSATDTSTGENKATVTIDSGIPECDPEEDDCGGIQFSTEVEYEGTADVDFSGATPTEVDATATLTDDRGPLDQAAVSGQTEDYEEEFACPDDEGTEENTARVTEDDSGAFDEDSASVTITCYDLSVTKTAEESRTRTWNWTIAKEVDPDNWSLFDGDTGTSDYVITLTKTGFTDSLWHVEGDITIHNNHPSLDADLTEVTDEIFDGIAADVDCPSLTVPFGADLVCTYEADLPNGDSRLNTATATQQNYNYDADGIGEAGDTTDYSGTETINFSGATTTDVNAEVNVTDSLEGSFGPFSDSDTIPYSSTFDCDDVEYTDGHGSYTVENTATIDETGQDASASVDVDCYILDVTKTADETLDRTFTWDIDKSADQDALELMPGETFPVNYTVDVWVTGSTDSNFDVTGDIVISNPNPDRDADLTEVVDEIFDGIAADVDCPSLTVPAGLTLTCTYEAQDLPDDTTRLNTATATQQNYAFDSDVVGTPSGTTDYSGTENVDFSGATINEIDECVDVFDTHAISIANPTGFLGTVCEDSAPAQFTYSVDIGPYTVEDCGEQTVDDTARTVTNDTDLEDSDSWTVVVTIPCPEGCTLTLGYWKTHNESFWGGAPADPNWFLLGPLGEETLFFDLMIDGQPATWFDVFWTNPAGRPYYQLAHQWMAAYLNTLSIQAIGGSIPSEVQDALDDGAALLDLWDGSEAGKSPDIKGKDAKAIRAEFVGLAGILGDFNEGEIGPGHCDEPIVIVDGVTVSGAPFLLAPIGLLAPIAGWLRRRATR